MAKDEYSEVGSSSDVRLNARRRCACKGLRVCRPGKAEPPPGKNHTSDAGTTLGFSGFALTAITTPTTSSAMPQAVNSGGKLWRIRKV